MDNISEILMRLGTVRNPVLFSSCSLSGLMMHFSKNVPESNRFAIFLLAVAVFLIAFAFYAYAFIHLPSSTQELVFLQDGKMALERHRVSAARPRSRTKPNA